jgi:hypothetical protein
MDEPQLKYDAGDNRRAHKQLENLPFNGWHSLIYRESGRRSIVFLKQGTESRTSASKPQKEHTCKPMHIKQKT